MSDEATGQGPISLEDAVGMLTGPPEKDTPETDEPEADELADTEADTEDEPEEVEDADSDDDQSEDGEAEDEADDDAEDDDTEDEDPIYRWTTSAGDEFEVPLSELQAGFLRRQDYTRKTTEAAEARKEAETLRTTLQEQQAQLADALAQWATPTEQAPDWAALAQQLTPQEYNFARAQWEQQQTQQQQAAQAYQQLQQQQREQQRQEGGAKLREAIPELGDPDKQQDVVQSIVSAAEHYGFGKEDLDGIYDHRVYVVLYDNGKALKAQRQRENTSAKVAKRVSKTPKALQPGAKTTNRAKETRKRQSTRDRFNKTGSFADAVKMLQGE